jgi:hypothetical protein
MTWKGVAHHALTMAMLVGVVWALAYCTAETDRKPPVLEVAPK